MKFVVKTLSSISALVLIAVGALVLLLGMCAGWLP